VKGKWACIEKQGEVGFISGEDLGEVQQWKGKISPESTLEESRW